MSVLDKLTEGIVNRDLQKEGAALLDKWEKTGLLEGIVSDQHKSGMARLLENQAKELLREASTMAGGDVEGFASVAFPIVRRVFGSLIANDLVSVQPMSLPSGLIFFLVFTFNSSRLGAEANASLHGGGRVGQELTGGVNLSSGSLGESGFYGLNQGYASPTGSATLVTTLIASGTLGAESYSEVTHASLGGGTTKTDLGKLCRHDADLSGSFVYVATVPGDSELGQLNEENLISLHATAGTTTSQIDNNKLTLIRRLTHMVGRSSDHADDKAAALSPTDATNTSIVMVFKLAHDGTGDDDIEEEFSDNSGQKAFTFAINDNFNNVTEAAGRGLGTIVGADTWGLENEQGIPEIDIKVDSVSVTAQTKKLKAKWTPELGQDLNAYHNLDAEVELTSILSEQIALEIDREILNDLVQGATAGTYYWSRRPGRFLNRESGAAIGSNLANESMMGADFTGTVSEWYETLVETLNDVSAQIHRKTLRGGANFLVCGPEVANILEFTAGFRANVTADSDRGTVGAVNVGNLSKKWDVYVDPYFMRNVVLIGRKGGSFLESGFVYAPYVPLQVTPTIFGVDDFVPRKGVMTRYAKKMVRPDMYGLVIVQDLVG